MIYDTGLLKQYRLMLGAIYSSIVLLFILLF